MRLGWFTTLSSSVLSLILHLVVGVLLIFSFEFTPQPKNQVRKDVNIVKAVAVDKKQVELELERIRKIEEEKHKKEKQRLDELEKKAKDLEQKRKAEEKKLADTKKKKTAEEKKRKTEQARVAKLEKEKKELEDNRKLEEKRLKEAKGKAEKLKAEEKARQQKIKEEKKIAERKLREKELADAMNAEEDELQKQKDQELINKIAARMVRSIGNEFNTTGLPEGLECVLRVRLIPGGALIDVSIVKSSGNEIFDRRAESATRKASPLPVPDDLIIFERHFRDNTITFKPTN
ncbi:MAG: cell envelope integrity protein TolA [Gammaproteobacteria bacterium]|nr:cell envelope integrity protein TolA [Gammaproteobacteria bacterium]